MVILTSSFHSPESSSSSDDVTDWESVLKLRGYLLGIEDITRVDASEPMQQKYLSAQNKHVCTKLSPDSDSPQGLPPTYGSSRDSDEVSSSSGLDQTRISVQQNGFLQHAIGSNSHSSNLAKR